MTSDDDRLAPVTPLFGQQPAASPSHPAGRGRGAGASGRRSGLRSASGAEGWAEADEALPGADEPGADEPAAGESGAHEPAAGEPAPVAALPTYAAFAAKSEPEAAARLPRAKKPLSAMKAAVARRDGFSTGAVDDDDGPGAGPEETVEAARTRAENISLHALSRRGVSSAEMAKTLRSRDLPDEVVEHEIERLERVGLLNDAELAENLVQTKQSRKGLGKSAISSELRQRGLAQEAIDAAVAEIDDDDEQARADEWAHKRAGQLRGLDQATAERRLNAFLMRRGYRSEVIRRAVESALPRGGSRGGGVRFE
ncbi:hypothetical protein AX769_10875 [Frondihabitans sp. PAMC 28766]|uniref:regulatory protein RecX n=1 Tax=Frondihabitans sp. PAMC 28766 TaxID=1795630 RepID=UPI00078CA74E|nr:regulatory protein RecX [Frondihabitans sp. PAMC 28766]AMM20557.1 hypothetical protein AX769_10875 [Frondihabitans sp. PAMC 28766]